MTDIIFIRTYHSSEEEFGHLAKFSYTEIANGLCWLAAVAIEHNYKTEIIDALALGLNNHKLLDLIIEKNPRWVGITACTLDIYAAADLAEKIKSVNPDIVIIVGGAHITAVPVETMERFSAFDIGVIGEGEATIIDLMSALERKNNDLLSEVDGIVYRDSGRILSTRPRQFIANLDLLPLPKWELLPNIRKYYHAPPWTMHSGQTVTVITSRGCPFQCIYCDRKVFGNKVRFHSAKYVLSIIKVMRFQYGIKHFRISDDNFIANRARLIEICNLILMEDLKISWSCLARVDSIDADSLALMKRAGCWSIAFGIETGSQQIHDFEKKGVSLTKIENAVAMVRRAGIKVIGFNMIGHPFETIETIKETINFNKKIKVDEFKTQFLIPFPGTEFYQNASRYGILDKDWKKMGVFKEPVFIPRGLTKKDLIKWNKRGFVSFYLQPRIILSYLLQLRSFT